MSHKSVLTKLTGEIIIEKVSYLAETWFSLLSQRNHEKASDICRDFLKRYGKEFHLDNLNEDDRNTLLMSLIFSKSLHEFTELSQITASNKWLKHPETTERVWFKLCACRERLQFLSHHYKGEIIEMIFSDLDNLEKDFQSEFGEGIYVSPGIVSDSRFCSVCGQDFRACSHITGRLYDGNICSHRSVKPRLNHLAIVEVPKDFRCRIWSWKIKQNNDGSITINVCSLTSFSVDDFLQEPYSPLHVLEAEATFNHELSQVDRLTSYQFE
ncbi:MAG: hypothetical protein F6J87_03135 [Spirulina sp. SIO3F2]|nr:hypothetical protein [Spirulina sp. SIO3F2]